MARGEMSEAERAAMYDCLMHGYCTNNKEHGITSLRRLERRGMLVLVQDVHRKGLQVWTEAVGYLTDAGKAHLAARYPLAWRSQVERARARGVDYPKPIPGASRG